MCTFWIAVILMAAPTLEADESPPAMLPGGSLGRQPIVPYRSGTELRDATRAALRRWARPSDTEADSASREFLVLYKELSYDDQLSFSQREELRAKVRSRLLKLSRQISKRAAIAKRQAKARRPASVDGPAHGNGVLAQRRGFGGRPAPGGIGGGMMGGGPFGRRAQPVDDHGEELIALIQQTVAPSTWDVNGGPGSIYYWRPGRAIVVRQMDNVHDEIADVLRQLGRLGR